MKYWHWIRRIKLITSQNLYFLKREEQIFRKNIKYNCTVNFDSKRKRILGWLFCYKKRLEDWFDKERLTMDIRIKGPRICGKDRFRTKKYKVETGAVDGRLWAYLKPTVSWKKVHFDRWSSLLLTHFGIRSWNIFEGIASIGASGCTRDRARGSRMPQQKFSHPYQVGTNHFGLDFIYKLPP